MNPLFLVSSTRISKLYCHIQALSWRGTVSLWVYTHYSILFSSHAIAHFCTSSPAKTAQRNVLLFGIFEIPCVPHALRKVTYDKERCCEMVCAYGKTDVGIVYAIVGFKRSITTGGSNKTLFLHTLVIRDRTRSHPVRKQN